jgi:hypothetical protein
MKGEKEVKMKMWSKCRSKDRKVNNKIKRSVGMEVGRKMYTECREKSITLRNDPHRSYCDKCQYNHGDKLTIMAMKSFITMR